MFISIAFRATSIDETNKTQQKVRGSKFIFKIIIIIIIINEKINVAFSRRTARTRNSQKKNKSRENVVSNSTEEEKK